MQLSRLQKLTLGLSGLVAFTIGAFILVSPQAFYTSYGITLNRDPNLLSELRAPGAGLATLGAIMLLGIGRRAMTQVAVVAAFAVYLAFPLGRLVSLAVDGVPSGSILAALAIEIVIACLLLTAFGQRRARAPVAESIADLPSRSQG